MSPIETALRMSDLFKVLGEVRNKRYSVDSRLTREERILFDKFAAVYDDLLYAEEGR
jgi:hypothetical protein